jgi:hypothetical protein
MADANAKRKLVEFLDEKAFQPVLDVDPDDYPADKQSELKDVQRATKSERERFQGYDSAKEVVEMYQDDLDSDEAKEVHRQLQDLGLPTIVDIRDEFEHLAHDLGVNR